MYLIYKPDGQEEQRWLFDPNRIRQGEMEAIEKRTGWPFGTEFLQALQKADSRARKALLWILLRRQHPTIKWEDVDFAHEEVVLEYDVEELAEHRRRVAESAALTDDERVLALEMLDQQMATAPPAPGKAPARSSDAATG